MSSNNLYWSIFEELPDLKFFIVTLTNKKLVCATLDNSVSFYGIQLFCPEQNMNLIEAIDILDPNNLGAANYIRRAFISTEGICFVETGMRYSSKDRDRLKIDYLISKIAGISTRRRF